MLLASAGASFCVDSDFTDIPRQHWAKDAVNDLVKTGITQGYPDGTFRGNKNVSRYETAMFLAKVSETVSAPTEDIDLAIEKLKSDLRTEIMALRAEIAQLKKTSEGEEQRPISGSYMTRIMFGNLLAGNTATPDVSAPVGPKVNYRLNTSFAKDLGKGANVKVNIDTMDAGFNGGQGDFSTKILDVEGNMKLNMGFEQPVDVKVTVGPGTVVHTEEADINGNFVARSENNLVYERPYSGIQFSTKLGSMNTKLGYFARKLSNTGEIDVNHLNLTGNYHMPRIFFADEANIGGKIDYLVREPQSTPAGPTDMKFTINADATVNKNVKYDLVYSMGRGDSAHAVMFGFGVGLMDVWNTGTQVNFKYRKVGSEYLYQTALLDEDIFAGIDTFGRLIGNGGGQGLVDIGLEVVQVLSESINLISRTDLRLASDNAYDDAHTQCGFTTEIGLAFDIAPNTILQGLYRLEAIPSAADQTTDLLQMVLSFTF